MSRVTAHVALRTRNGTASPVAFATAPPAAEPSAWPGAQARFMSANAQARLRSIRCAASASRAMAGAQARPNEAEARTATKPRRAARLGQGRTAAATVAAARLTEIA